MRNHPLTIRTEGRLPEDTGWMTRLVRELNAFFAEGDRQFYFAEHVHYLDDQMPPNEGTVFYSFGNYPCEIRLSVGMGKSYGFMSTGANGENICWIANATFETEGPGWQIFVLTAIHEFLHGFGCGLGEYYSLLWMPDPTGVEPLFWFNAQVPGDRYYAARKDMLQDPLLMYSQTPRMCELTRRIVQGDYRLAARQVPIQTLMKIQVRDEQGGPVAARVRVWKITRRDFENAETGGEAASLFDGEGDTIEFNWCSHVSEMYSVKAVLIKVHADGYVPLAHWVSVFDLERASLNEESQIVEVRLPKLIPIPIASIEHPPMSVSQRRTPDGRGFVVRVEPKIAGQSYVLISTLDGGVKWDPLLTQVATGVFLEFTIPVQERIPGELFKVGWVPFPANPEVTGPPPMPV